MRGQAHSRGGAGTGRIWRRGARGHVSGYRVPGTPGYRRTAAVQSRRTYAYDGLQVEELAWQLPYGPPTEAILLKPLGAKGPLPGVLALHDRGRKYFGKEKIADTGALRHPCLREPETIYDGVAWANAWPSEATSCSCPTPLVSAAGVLLADVPAVIRPALADDGGAAAAVNAYNEWTGSMNRS